MPIRDRWRKALTVSVFVHCLLLTGAGWLGVGLFEAVRPAEPVEVELITDPGQGEPTAVPSAAAPAAAVRAPVVAVTPAAVAEPADDAVTEGLAAPATAARADGAAAAVTTPALAGAGPASSKRLSAPRLLARTEPQYPEEARRAGAEGTVAVRIEVKETGQPGDIAVVRSSGRASFDAAAVEAVRSWRFVPAQEADTGQAVRCYTTVSVIFRLRS